MAILENLFMTTNTIVTILYRRKARHIAHGDGFPRSVGSRKRSIKALLLNSWLGDDTGNARFVQ